MMDARAPSTTLRTGRFGQDPDAFRIVYRQCLDRMMRGLKASSG